MKPGVIALAPWLKEVVWGSGALQDHWNKDFPSTKRLGESWEISCIPGGESRHLASGSSLREQFLHDPAWFLGDEVVAASSSASVTFPFLVKLLATSERLSLQVHPSNHQALELEGEAVGKHEAWLILEAEPGAYIYLGVNEGVTEDQLREALSSGLSAEVTPLLRKVLVQPGDLFDISPGTLHALGANITLLEVQQPSDTTYRVFDWERVGLDGEPRPLHLEKALKVADLSSRPEALEPIGPMSGMEGQRLFHGPCFRLERWVINERHEMPVTDLLGVVCLAGEGKIWSRGQAPLPLEQGSACVVPRGVSILTLDGCGLEVAVILPPG